jgi:hypothetical protein
MALVIKGSTSGQVTIDVPAEAGTNTLTIPASTFTVPTSSGKVLQVVQTIKTNTTTVSNPTSYTEVSGLTVNITPSSASNKVLIIGTYCIMGDTNTQGYAAFYRDTTQIGVGNAVGNRIKASTQAYPNHINQATNSSFCFLDSPSSTSQITYALRTRNQGSGNVYVNRSQTYTNSAASSTNASTITVMEIQE